MLLALILILITVPFYYLKPKKYFLLLFILLTASTVIITTSDSFQRGIKSFNQAVSSDTYTESWGHRLGYKIIGVDIFAENPVIGRGINDISRPIYQKAEDEPKYFIGEFRRQFHDEHINILVSVGIFGYILLIYFLFFLFKLNIKDKNIHVFKNITIIILYYLMIGEHYLSFKSTTNFFSILIALFITYKYLEKTQENSDTIK
jgi:O-antigen ligase